MASPVNHPASRRLMLLPALAILATLSFPAAARTVYCCEGDNGKKTCADVVPPQCAGRAITEIGPNGVMKRRDAPVSAEERARVAEQERLRKENEERIAAERKRNQILLDSYSSTADIDLRRDRTLAEIERNITHLRNEQTELGKRRDKLKKDIDGLGNKPMPPEFEQTRQTLDAEQKDLDETIAAKKKELETTRHRFEEDKRRYEALMAAQPKP